MSGMRIPYLASPVVWNHFLYPNSSRDQLSLEFMLGIQPYKNLNFLTLIKSKIIFDKCLDWIGQAPFCSPGVSHFARVLSSHGVVSQVAIMESAVAALILETSRPLFLLLLI